MAEGPDLTGKNIQELEQEITCGICHDHYEEPKVFPCCHYYCKQCIAKLASQYPPNQPFPCPDCREPTLLPDCDPDKLPTAFFINRMKALHSRMEKASGRVEALCEMCSGGDKSVAFCRQCAQFICADCIKSHKKIKFLFGHEITTLEELKQGGAKVLNQGAPPPMCTAHDEPKKLYCSDCSELICRDCIIIDHARHKYEFVKTAAPEMRKKLTAQAAPLEEMVSHLHKTIDEVTMEKNAVEANGKSVAIIINSYFDELKKVLEEHRQQLLDESSNMVKEKIGNLTAQEKNAGLSLATVQSLTDFVARTLANASDEEVVSMQTQVLSRIEGEVEKQKERTATQKLTKKLVFGVKLSFLEKLRDLCSTESKIITSAEFDPHDCTVEGRGIRLAVVGNPECVTVVVSTYIPAVLNLKGELKSKVNGSIQPLQVSICPTDMTKYVLKYTPKVRGSHQLAITVNDAHISGSPLSVFVRSSSDVPERPVRVIHLTSTNYITFNSLGQMIITRDDNSIDKLDKNGTLIRRIFPVDSGVITAEGVAVDKHDNIYVADRKGNRVVKLNKKMKVLRRLEGKVGSVVMRCMSGLAVHNEQVLVCDSGNNRVIVLTKDLQFIREFGSKGSGNGQLDNLHDITTDTQGNIYVTDRGNHRVQVFSSEGKFIRTIGTDILKSPSGLCVNNDYVYVVDNGRPEKCIVFTTDGQYVTLFAELSGDPYGIAVDSDGFVFVCCYIPGKVLIF